MARAGDSTRRRRARRRARGRRRSAPRRPPRARPPTCPGRSASSCRRRSSPARADGATGTAGASVEARMREDVGHDAVLPGVAGEPGGLPLAPRAARGTRPASVSWTASSASSSWALGVDEARAALRRASRGSRRRARAARCPGMRTPTQTSPPGSWSRCRSLQTTGIARAMGRERMPAQGRASRSAHGRRPQPARPRSADRRARARAHRLDRRRRRRRRRPRHRRARRARAARGPRRRAHRRHRDRAGCDPRRCASTRLPLGSRSSTAPAR